MGGGIEVQFELNWINVVLTTAGEGVKFPSSFAKRKGKENKVENPLKLRRFPL